MFRVLVLRPTVLLAAALVLFRGAAGAAPARAQLRAPAPVPATAAPAAGGHGAAPRSAAGPGLFRPDAGLPAPGSPAAAGVLERPGPLPAATAAPEASAFGDPAAGALAPASAAPAADEAGGGAGRENLALPRGIRARPPLGRARLAQLRSLFRLSDPEYAGLQRALAETEFQIPGALPFSDRYTFSLELEFRARGRALAAVRGLAPAHWGYGNENYPELKTRNAGGTYHVNAAEDWDELAARLRPVQKALPSGLKSVHIHVGKKGLPRKPAALINRDRMGPLMSFFESMWLTLGGYGLRFNGDPERLYDFEPAPRLDDHSRMINLSARFPTVEYKVTKGLVERRRGEKRLLEWSTLKEDLWWTFAVFEHLVSHRAPLQQAALGLPVLAGHAPSPKQLRFFLDLVYGEDVAGKAIAIKRFARLKDAPSPLTRGERAAAETALARRYAREGLHVVYELHRRHDGVDDKLEEHLLDDDGRLLRQLARDLLARRSARGAREGFLNAWFPQAIRAPLERAITEELARERRERLTRIRGWLSSPGAWVSGLLAALAAFALWVG